MGIHTDLLLDFSPTINWYITHVIFRLAVPFFFVTSGFLYGLKILEKKSNLKEITLNYIKRLMIPFFFWLGIGLIPEMINQYNGNIFSTFYQIVKRCIFYPYGALWYIYALMIAVGVLYFFYKKGRYLLPIVIGFILYLFALLCNTYYFVAEKSIVLKQIVDSYMQVFISARNGIFVGVLFVSLGVFLAKLLKEKKIKDWNLIYVTSILSFCLFLFEIMLVRNRNMIDDHSMFIMTPIVSSILVLLLTKFSRNKSYKKLRNLSTGIYFLHRPVLAYLLLFIQIPSHILLFIIVLSLAFAITWILQKINNRFIKKIIT